MSTTSDIPKLKIVHKFPKTKVADVLSRGYTVFTDIRGQANMFTTTPIPLATLKQPRR
jgi:hypothetical protein